MEKKKVHVEILGGKMRKGENDAFPFPSKDHQALDHQTLEPFKDHQTLEPFKDRQTLEPFKNHQALEPFKDH